MYLTYVYFMVIAILSCIALIHLFRNRSLYGVFMLAYLFWPGIFKLLCKHFIIIRGATVTLFSFKIQNSGDFFLETVMIEKLVSVFLVIPFFLYVIRSVRRTVS